MVLATLTQDKRSLMIYCKLKQIPYLEEGLSLSERELKSVLKESRKLLNELENRRLIQKVQQGDSSAEVQLLEKYNSYIKKLAWRYTKNGLENEDLIQEGNIGLIVASRRFDLRQNNRFLTYAHFWIRSMMLDAVQTQGKIIIPKYKRSQLTKIYRKKEELMDTLQREPTIKELSLAYEYFGKGTYESFLFYAIL